MRFRTVEDERVYNALRIEIFLRLGVHLPPIVMNEVLRNFGKIEGLLYGEGIRQGMAVAALAELVSVDSEADLGAMPAIVAHATFYGDATTPLARVETARVLAMTKKVSVDLDSVDDPWLDASPLPFAPQTLAEATKLYGPELEPSPAGSVRVVADLRAMPTKAPTITDVGRPMSDEAIDRMLEDSSNVEPLMTRDASPDFLDRVRDELQHMLQNGWKPANWSELILGLHQKMQTDAFALDLQLSGHLGRTVLAQVGLFDIAPPSIVMTGEDGSIRFADNLADLMR